MVNPIPFYDFGGEGAVIHFAHANGYPPACYKRMLAPLLDHYRVLAAYHRPLWPDSQPDEVASWRHLADDLLRFLVQEGLEQVVGVGHSLGAVVTMYAALQEPQRFRALVLIEPVFLMPAILQLLSQTSREELKETHSLIGIADSRRNSWPDRQAAFDHFRPKRVFARWSDDTLWDYVTHGTERSQTGEVVLSYSPQWEAQMYALPPTDVWELLPQVRQPTLAICGDETETLVPAAWQMWRLAQPDGTFVEVAGAGHLVPMEKPRELAALILDFLARRAA